MGGNHLQNDTRFLCASVVSSFSQSAEFYFHVLDLRPDLDTLFHSFHKSCVQRKIQRAEHENLVYEEGRSEAILEKFYRLVLLTRRRHQLPPQPRGWFRNLLDCVGDGARIHLVSKDGQPIASILTLFHKQTLVYKYGCSDSRFHRLGGMPLLFWKAIQEGKRLGAQEFDLGRSEMNDPGQAVFKGHLGANGSTLVYFSYPPLVRSSPASGWKMKIARSTVGWLPDTLLITAGKLLYRHVG
jgi:lipid II:glycine glycyltransferase (peptidoglycan interpeptide bridge formation enzyme)